MSFCYEPRSFYVAGFGRGCPKRPGNLTAETPRASAILRNVSRGKNRPAHRWREPPKRRLQPGLAAPQGRRISNPPQVTNLPHKGFLRTIKVLIDKAGPPALC